VVVVSVYLVQHGKAFDESVDPERRLTPDGIRESELVANYLAGLGISVPKIVHSGKTRAKQTAEIFAKHLGVANVEVADGLNPNDDPIIWAQRINELTSDLMIVGHLPHLSRLTSLLVMGNPNIRIVEFRYSSVLKLTRTNEGWVISWFITPGLVQFRPS
jgi:phosphohistidine phosphatase SixA